MAPELQETFCGLYPLQDADTGHGAFPDTMNRRKREAAKPASPRTKKAPGGQLSLTGEPDHEPEQGPCLPCGLSRTVDHSAPDALTIRPWARSKPATALARSLL